MKYSTEDDPSNPKRFVVKVVLFSGDIWFTQVDKEPPHEELAAWVDQYQEAASKRLKGDPLIVDVVVAGLRPK